MSTVTYRHDNSMSFKKNGDKHVLREKLIDGEKGLTFHYLKKEGEKKFYSITVKEIAKDSFDITIKNGEETKEDKTDIVGLTKLIKATPGLKFVDIFLSKDRKMYKSRGKKSSKKIDNKK